MAAARFAMRRMTDVRFWKLCGSGSGEGFTPLPNTQVWAILAVWDDEVQARRNVRECAVFRLWAERADESWTVFLAPTAARGAWSGETPFNAAWTAVDAPESGPLAVLTRASIRPLAARRFWRREPDISTAIGMDRNVLFKIGIGEVPWLHQVTFSIWPDAASMTAFAREDGPHAKAIRAVREGGWFKEELYARFRVLGSVGCWEGTDPMTRIERQAA